MAMTEERKVERFGVSGSAVDVFGGLVAVVLTILGLVGINPLIMVAIASIAIGVALMAESSSYAAEYSKLLAYTGRPRTTESELGGGLGAEAVAGLAAVVLGILSIIGINPPVLMASAVIVLGAGIMFGSGVTDRIRAMRVEAETEHEQTVTRQAVAVAEGAQMLVGISAVVLGILALVGFAPMTLILIGLLATGSSLLLSGASTGARFYTAFHRT